MLSKRFPEKIAKRLRLPLIAAPMLSVSGPDLAIAACQAGVIGSFPLANARSIEGVEAWLKQIETAGSPVEAIGPLHDVGSIVFADVATIHHAEKAIASGVDGLILLTAGAGGQTGWLNPLAFVRATRAMFDGPIVLAGGISDGAALWAAEILGCDLAYMGTKFIATIESMAAPAYKQMLVRSGMDDVMLTQAFTGLDTNMLTPSMIAAGLDPKTLPPRVSMEEAAKNFGGMSERTGPRRYKDIWSAGHSVSGVERIQSAAELVERTLAEYLEARDRTARLLSL